MKKIAISQNKEGIEKLVNDFFYSKDYIIDSDLRLNNKNFKEEKIRSINDDYKIEFKRKRFYFYEVE